MKKIYLAAGLLILLMSCSSDNNGIRPYSANPSYWQYKGKPVLLLGATDNDNLFQNLNLKTHLDSLKAVGGNVIRNTMSDRDPGDKRAFAINNEGKYDLNRWNDEYWEIFENMLKLTSERDIIVQIEVWDRFDHSREQWLTDPYNPKNNINYTYNEAGLDSDYPLHPGANAQPFFFTVPELNNNEVLLKYQQAFVEKLLSISLKYDNVLYCIDNETSGMEEWATFWAEFIRAQAGEKEIYITQMWDSWDMTAAVHKRTLDHPERYDFIDISQNSHITAYDNWERAQYVFDYIKGNPRPVNSTKIYGSDAHEPWLNRGMTTEHAVQTFFRNITGGFASSRFHRPPHGLSLSPLTASCIKTMRKIEKLVKMWDIVPRMDLLSGYEKNQAYLAAKEGESYMVYFTGPGSVKLDLRNYNRKFEINRINIKDAEWTKKEVIKGGEIIDLKAVDEGVSFAVLRKR